MAAIASRISAIAASLFSGALLATGGYGLVAAVAGAVAVLPVGLIGATAIALVGARRSQREAEAVRLPLTA